MRAKVLAMGVLVFLGLLSLGGAAGDVAGPLDVTGDAAAVCGGGEAGEPCSCPDGEIKGKRIIPIYC